MRWRPSILLVCLIALVPEVSAGESSSVRNDGLSRGQFNAISVQEPTVGKSSFIRSEKPRLEPIATMSVNSDGKIEPMPDGKASDVSNDQYDRHAATQVAQHVQHKQHADTSLFEQSLDVDHANVMVEDYVLSKLGEERSRGRRRTVRNEKEKVQLERRKALKLKAIAKRDSKEARKQTKFAELTKQELVAALEEAENLKNIAMKQTKEARRQRAVAYKANAEANKQHRLAKDQRIVAETLAKRALASEAKAKASEIAAKDNATEAVKSKALAEEKENKASEYNRKMKEQAKLALIFILLFSFSILIILGFIAYRVWRWSKKAEAAMAMANELAEEEEAAAALKALRDEVDNPELREDMHLRHTTMVGALLSGDKDRAVQIFAEMKERAQIEEAKIAPWIIKRRNMIEVELGQRMATLESITRPSRPCFQTDVGHYGPESDNKEYLAYARIKASFAQESYGSILTGITTMINSEEKVSALEPIVGALATEFDFKNTLKLAIKDSSLTGGDKISLKLAKVKSMESAGPKLDKLLTQKWPTEKPVGRYITDWNRAMFVSADPFMLAIAFRLLEETPDVEILRVNNKLSDPDLRRTHPDWATNILVNFRFTVPDLQKEGSFVQQVGEVQFILEDFFVVDGIQHTWFEVTRRVDPEEIKDSPIFKK